MASESAEKECRGLCLHEIEFVGEHEDDERFDVDGEHVDVSEDEVGFCDFVCQFISLECPQKDKCVEQPCANYALCGNVAPQWLLDSRGGLCLQPCAMFHGRAFEFSSFAEHEACPVCLEAGAVSVVYECGHMVCAQCYGGAAFSEAATEIMKRCPICRKRCNVRARAVMHRSLFE